MIVRHLAEAESHITVVRDGNLITIRTIISCSWITGRAEFPIFEPVEKNHFISMNTKEMTLSRMGIGESCVIESFTDAVMKQKLLEMGCLPGEIITIDRLAPFGCPMAIDVAGSILSIRVDEADHIIVKPLSKV